ncbi:MAG: hypothetical protein JXR95_03670 [Deltaproteobacteria bacterium]|nr:hypothetical protein [Deltaproteobacteria bacterium]
MKFPSIRLLVALYMSNHSHLIYEDGDGDAPVFTAELHRNIAKFMNTNLKRKENFWSSDKPSLPVLGDNNDTLMKIVYTMLNPVKAGLVHLPSLWPGEQSCFLQI